MQRSKLATIGTIAMAVGLAGATAKAEYRLVDLGSISVNEGAPVGTPDDFSSGWNAGSLNNNGEAVGYSTNQFGFRHAFSWSNGVMTDLGSALPGDSTSNESWATALNNNGLIAGYSQYDPSSSFFHAAINQNNTWTTIGALNNSTRISYAFGVNDAGQVVGQSSIVNNNNRPYHAFMYSNGTMTDIGSKIPGTGISTFSYAFQINNHGVAVGYYTDSSGFDHVFTYDSTTGQATDLGFPTPLGGNQADAASINDAGQIVGNSYNPTLNKNFGWMYSNGTWTDLGAMTHPISINNNGDIVGSTFSTTSGTSAMLYHNGTITDLNTMISLDPNWHISGVSSINDLGQILVQADFNDGTKSYSHAAILNPLLAGDANGDDHVDLIDLQTVLSHFGVTTSFWGDGNFDGGPTVDLTDLGDVLNNFGLTSVGFSAASGSIAVVSPEPASVAALFVWPLFALSRRNRAPRSV